MEKKLFITLLFCISCTGFGQISEGKTASNMKDVKSKAFRSKAVKTAKAPEFSAQNVKAYCETWLDCTDDDLITNVTFREINNTTECSQDGYGDYTNLQANVAAGHTYPISVTVGNGYFERVSVWVDWNNNNSFDASEFLGEIGTGGIGVTLNGNISIPSGTANGLYRMRILVYASGVDEPASENPCIENGEFGEYEDYTIKVDPLLGVDNTSESVISYYPNPVKDYLYIVTKEPVKNISVYNSIGQKIVNNSCLKNEKVDMSHYAPGIYIITLIKESGRTEVFKVLKK